MPPYLLPVASQVGKGPAKIYGDPLGFGMGARTFPGLKWGGEMLFLQGKDEGGGAGA